MLKELDAGLKKVLSGDLQSLILGLMMTPEQFEANRLRKAMEVCHISVYLFTVWISGWMSFITLYINIL